MNDFLISSVASWTVGRDLSLGSSGKEVMDFLASCVEITSATALVISAESSLGEREIWPKPEDLPNILFDEEGKMSVKSVGEGGEEYARVE